jgi:hypothetical protein
LGKTKTSSKAIEDIDAVVYTAELLLAWTTGEYWDVGQPGKFILATWLID